MTIRKALSVFAAILAVLAASIHFAAKFVVERSMPPDKLIEAVRQAESRGESDLAIRLRIKGVYYSGDPRRFVEPSSGTAAIDGYLAAILAMREGRPAEAEELFGRVANTDSPLLAARARIRLEEMRYRTGFPNADRIPF